MCKDSELEELSYLILRVHLKKVQNAKRRVQSERCATAVSRKRKQRIRESHKA